MKKMMIIALTASLSATAGFAEDEAPPVWASSIALGATINDGNTENSLGTANLTLDHNPNETSASRLALDWQYGETDDEKTTDKGKAAASYKYIFSERSYFTLNASAEYDDISDLDYRWLVSPGIGYYVFKDDAAYLFVEAGPGILGEKKAGVDQGEEIVYRIAERYERVTESSAKYWQAAEYLAQVDDSDAYILNAEIGAEAPLSEKLGLRLVVKNTYDSNPAPGRENNDLSVIAGLSYTLL